MENLKITDVTPLNVWDLIYLCIPPERWEDASFKEGAKAKRRWVERIYEKFGPMAKLAYLEGKPHPVGMIQFLPQPEEKIVEITCIFVPRKENARKGIGKALLNALLEEMKKPKPYFDNTPPLGIVVNAFEVPGFYSQPEFFKRMGFKQASEDNPNLLFYPLTEGFTYVPKPRKYIPQEEDKGKALIFYHPFCPWSFYFADISREAIKEVTEQLPIRVINEFEEREEVEKRGEVPLAIVNKKPIKTFIMDRENFMREVKEALKDE